MPQPNQPQANTGGRVSESRDRLLLLNDTYRGFDEVGRANAHVGHSLADPITVLRFALDRYRLSDLKDGQSCPSFERKYLAGRSETV
jgi:hypothetical protein